MPFTLRLDKAQKLGWSRSAGARSVVVLAFRLELASLLAEARQVNQSPLLKGELQSSRQHFKTIFHATPEVDRGRLFEIFRGTGNFSDAKTKVHALREHLVIEHEIVGIFEERKLGEHLAAKGTIASVVFGKLYPEKQIFKSSQQAVRDV